MKTGLSDSLSDPLRDPPVTRREGEVILTSLEGVSLYRMPVHADGRGRVVEVMNPLWEWGGGFAYAHTTSIFPGKAKGWAMHREFDDHYFVVSGALTVALFDDRDDSPTRGQLIDLPLSEDVPQTLRIPAGVWHALGNYGDSEAVLMNFPSRLYNYASPDKLRLPLRNDRIPYDFSGLEGY